MKAIVLGLILMSCCHLAMAQQDKISFTYNRLGYKNVAQRRFMELYSKEAESKIPVFSRFMLSSIYKAQDLAFISIPVLGWNNQSYKCGDNLEPLIAFKQDFLFQEVIIVTKEKGLRVGAFDLFDSFNEEIRKKDSIDNVQSSLLGKPVMPDGEAIERRIHRYCLENPNVFVFMIRGLDGYYAVIEGALVKLVLKRGKIRGVPGSDFACKNYGQAFINDAITNSFKTGYEHLSCIDCKVHKSIKIDIVNKQCQEQR